MRYKIIFFFFIKNSFIFLFSIYKKLKQELETKKQNVENTIRSAGKAYFSRNRAEEDLKNLQAKAEDQKKKFEKEYKELNQNIQYDKRFKQFINGKVNNPNRFK